jgi:WD40 repeat protein
MRGILIHALPDQEKSTTCCTYSNDGQILAYGSYDGTIRIWNIRDRRETIVLTGHTSAITSLCMTPDKQTLVSGSNDTTVRIWNIARGTATAVCRGHTGVVTSVILPAGGKHMVSGSWDRTLRIWRLPDGAPLRILDGHRGQIRCCASSSDGRLIVSGDTCGMIRCWGFPGGEWCRTYEGHQPVTGITLLPDSRTVASSHEDGSFRLWTLPWTKPIASATPADLDYVRHIIRDLKAEGRPFRQWDFIEALLVGKCRFDIEQGEPVESAGMYDIEIA